MNCTLLKTMLTFYLFTASQCRINARQRVSAAGVEPSSSNDGMPECSGHGASVCDGFGWTLFKGKCYKVLEGLMDWNHIIAACKSESAILVCIQNEDENHFVGQLIAKPIERSIENYRLETTLFNTFWIGLNRVKDGDRYLSTWVNGEKARFGNLPEITTTVSTTGANHKYPWGEGQPSGANKFTDPTGAKEQCTHMFNADGHWNDAECRVQMSGGVCQKFPK
uniref:C-type lectin domain-containing protein n=1 Tax=Globodera pallida TaxID=36090 RepID=A0A183CLQ0_GLOPA